jgi:transcriptional regulator with XRE-family HTH domain
MSSADLIREARLRARLTQAALAARVGTTQSAIARWEAGGAEPSLATLSRVIRACGLELRIGLDDADPGEVSLIERNLALSPAGRLDQLVRTVAFLRAGRTALARRRRA